MVLWGDDGAAQPVLLDHLVAEHVPLDFRISQKIALDLVASEPVLVGDPVAHPVLAIGLAVLADDLVVSHLASPPTSASDEWSIAALAMASKDRMGASSP